MSEKEIIEEVEEETVPLSSAITSILLDEAKAPKKESEDEDEMSEEEEEEAKVEEEEDEVEEAKPAKKEAKKSVKEDLAILLNQDETFSEDFKATAQTLFEAALSEKVVAECERLQEKYDNNLKEEVADIRESLVEKIDSYIGYVVESWIEENEVAVDASLRTDVTESFMENLKSLFVESYIEVPESKKDLTDELANQVSDLEEQLESSKSDSVVLSEGVIDLTRERILTEASEGLASTQIEKLRNLTAELEFESKDSFSGKVDTIKESVFGVESAEEIVEDNQTTSDVEVIVEGNVEVSDTMSIYSRALDRQ